MAIRRLLCSVIVLCFGNHHGSAAFDNSDTIKDEIDQDIVHAFQLIEYQFDTNSDRIINMLDLPSGVPPVRRQLWQDIIQAKVKYMTDDYVGSIESFKRILTSYEPGFLGGLVESFLWRQLAIAVKEGGDPVLAATLLNEVIDKGAGSDNPFMMLQVARAMVGIACIYMEEGSFADALDILDSVVEIYQEETEALLMEVVVLACLTRVSGYLALREYESVVEKGDLFLAQYLVEGQDCGEFLTAAAAEIKRKMAHAYFQLGEMDAAFGLFDEIVSECENSRERAGLKMALMSKIDKAECLIDMGDPDAGVELLMEVIDREKGSDRLDVQITVADALLSAGRFFVSLGLTSKALDAFTMVAELYGSADDADLVYRVAMAGLEKGMAHYEVNDSEAVIRAFNSVAGSLDKVAGTHVQSELVGACLNRANIYYQVGFYDCALKEYSALIERYERSGDPLIMQQVAKSYMRKGDHYEAVADAAAAIHEYDALIRRFSGADEAELEEYPALAMIRKAAVFAGGNDKALAMKTYREFLNIYAGTNNPKILAWVVTGRKYLANLTSGN